MSRAAGKKSHRRYDRRKDGVSTYASTDPEREKLEERRLRKQWEVLALQLLQTTRSEKESE